MPTYWYKTHGREGATSEGTIAAANRREALQRLIDSGRCPIDLREQRAKEGIRSHGFRLQRRAIRLATFTGQLATLSASGTPIVKSLSVLAEQLNDPHAKQILTQISESVQSGNTFADALDEHPSVFPKLMTSMVRVGEKGGTLDDQLLQLTELYEKDETLKGEVRSAIAYPLLVLVLGVVSAIVLVAFFIPRLESLFIDVGQALPLPTRILLAVSHFITGHALGLIMAVAVVSVALKWALRQDRIRLHLDRFKLRIPGLGTLLRNLDIARFTRMLGSLTHAGISIVQALDIVQPVLVNAAIADTARKMTSRIRTGERLAVLMKESRIFPPLSVQMVATGEETGHLDRMLLQLADAYDRETAASTKVVASLLAPALILFVAAMVGFILISMMLPIFKLSTVMH